MTDTFVSEALNASDALDATDRAEIVDRAAGHDTAVRHDTTPLPTVSPEVRELDALWEHEWSVTEDRAYAPQKIDVEIPVHPVGELRARRALDIVVSGVGLIVLAPLLVLLALAVRLTSAGPAIFSQQRPGRGGELFTMYKFRTMTAGTDREVHTNDELRSVYESNDFKLDADDPRITPLGRLLRATSLDELPQLVNVLRGDMSLVGVRPLLPEQLQQRPITDQQLYRTLRPGLTGLWQVEGRSTISGDERIALDRTYVTTWSLTTDLKVLARTPWALVRGEGAH